MSKSLSLKMFFLWLVSWLYIFFLIGICIGILYLLFIIIKYFLFEIVKFSFEEGDQYGARNFIRLIFLVCVIGFYPLILILSFIISIFTRKKEYKLSGYPLDRKIFANLYVLVDEISLKLKVPKINEIRIDPSINSQIFEFKKSFLSPHKRYLIIGFPFFIIFSLEELKAIIAHELAHMTQGKRLVRRLNSVKDFYNYYIVDNEKGKTKISGFPFFCDIVIGINELLFEASKQNEFDADSKVLKIVDKDLYATALVKTKYYTSVIDQFPDEVWKVYITNHEALRDFFNRMEQYITSRNENEYYKEFITNINEEISFFSSTHPNLKERLENINAQIPYSISVNNNVLRAFFTEEQTSLLFEKMNALWYETFDSKWKQKYADYKAEEEILKSYERKRLSENQLIEKALLVYDVYGKEQALKEFKKAEERYPDNMNIKYLIGKILLQKLDAEGISYLDHVVEKSYEFAPYAARELYNYYLSKRDFVNSAKYFNIGVSIIETNQEILEERNKFNVPDSYSPAFFDTDTINNMIQTIKTRYPSVKKVYIFKKDDKGEVEIVFPVYVIGIKYKKYDENVHNSIINECLIPFKHTVLSLNSRVKLEYYLSEVVGGRIL